MGGGSGWGWGQGVCERRIEVFVKILFWGVGGDVGYCGGRKRGNI